MRNLLNDNVMFLDLLDGVESVEELSQQVEELADALNIAVCDICDDNGWDMSKVSEVYY